jgi:hypothetical protein
MYQIDQSGKIEQTNKNTVIALSNSIQLSVILKAKEKRAIQSIYRVAGKPKIFSVQVFAALTYLLIEKSGTFGGIIYIDKEYPGYEDVIKSYIVQLSRKVGKNNLDPDSIRFIQVGKTSKAHLFGYKHYKKGIGDFIIRKEDVLALVLNFEG